MPEKDDTGEVSPARPIWSGTISFGLVSVPVNLLAASRSDRVSLRMVSPEGTPLKRRYFAPRDDRELSMDEIVRGFEIEKDRYVIVDDDELERLAPDRSRDIDLRLFVPLAEIDPMHFERAYYLTPAAESTKAYRLLATVMEDTGLAGIATFVMRGKEYLVAIIAENGILRAETMRFADEIRTPADVGLPEPKKPAAKEVARFERQIEKLVADELDESELVERSAERVLALARRKRRKGEDVHRFEPARAASREVVDLMEMLQRSLSGNGGDGRRDGDALGRMSKTDLYRRAQEMEIPGRSGMSRDELIEAIRAGDRGRQESKR